MITNAEYAKLAGAAYQDKGAPKGWERLPDKPQDNNVGYDCAAFRKIGTKEIVIAHRGTEPIRFDGDWTANLQMGLRKVPDQYEYARKFLEQIKDTYRDATLSLTGHSLGGALAQLQAAQTGLSAVTFNPYGAKTLIPALNEKYGLDLDPEASYANIANHRTLFDGVSQIPGSAQLGSMNTHIAASELVGLIAVVATRSPALLTALSGYWSHSADRFTGEIYAEADSAPSPDNATHLGQERGHTFPEITVPHVEATRERVSQARSISSPIILDLDGDGIETTAVTAGAWFDHAGDGFAERTGWVGADDGLLVWDRNGDGRIGSGGELFGAETRLANGGKAAHGFEALKELDANGDGRVDARDAAFAELRVWKDADGDGLSQAGELFTLAEAGVQSLATAYADSSLIDGHGNAHRQIGGYTRTDGTRAIATDVWFATDTAYSIATDWRDVGGDIAALPDLPGSGTVRDLRQAMALDATGRLQMAVAAFTAEPDEGRRHGLAREIVLLWAGVDGLDPASRGGYVDARELAAQERLTGQDFNQPGWGANPGSTAGKRLAESFARLVDTFHAQLEAQTRFADLYGQAGLAWEAATGTPRLDLSGVAEALALSLGRDQAAGLVLVDGFARNLAALGYADEAGWDDLAERLAGTTPAAADVLRLARLPTLNGTDLADDLSGGAGDERLLGFGGDDTLAGKSGNDVLEGGAGNDRLDGGSGDDTLLGGADDDWLNGGSGSDVYAFGRGFGHDTLRQYDSGADSLDRARFDGLNSDAVREVSRDGDDLNLDFGDDGTLTVSGYFDSAARRVDRFDFADGASWDDQAIKARAVTRGTEEADTRYGYNGVGNRILGLAGDDRLHGGDANDLLSGDAGNDRLYGKSGDDTLVGGAGDDVLQGGLGNDVYRFDRGAGGDTWIENDATAGNLDIARFGADISFDQLWFGRSGNDLVTKVIGTADQIVIERWYSGGAQRIERFEAGGRALLDSRVDALVQAMAAFAPPAAGQTSLPDDTRAVLEPVLAANWG